MNNVALIISTYDDSEDLWMPLEQTYLEYWKDIRFPIFLTTNQKVFNSQLFNSLTIGNELSWSDNLIKSLDKITQEYVLLTFDDLFLTARVDNLFIEKLMQQAIQGKFNYLQFYRSISKGRRMDDLIFKKLIKQDIRILLYGRFGRRMFYLNYCKKMRMLGNLRRMGI